MVTVLWAYWCRSSSDSETYWSDLMKKSIMDKFLDWVMDTGLPKSPIKPLSDEYLYYEYYASEEEKEEHFKRSSGTLRDDLSDFFFGIVEVLITLIYMDTTTRKRLITTSLKWIFSIPILVPMLWIWYIKEDYLMPIIWAIQDKIDCFKYYCEHPCTDEMTPIITDQNRKSVIIQLSICLILLIIIIVLYCYMQQSA